jgi:thioredoxin-related protein
MQTFINDYSEPTFKRVPSNLNKAEKTVSELLNKLRIKLYKRVLTFRRLANRILRIPQKTQFIRIPERVAKTNFQHAEEELFYWKKLDKNIIVEHKKFKNKQVITVKTDINYRFLKPI